MEFFLFFVQSRRQIWLKLVFICVFLCIAIKHSMKISVLIMLKKCIKSLVYFKKELEDTFFIIEMVRLSIHYPTTEPVYVMWRYFEQILEWINKINISEFGGFFTFGIINIVYYFKHFKFMMTRFVYAVSSKECKLMLSKHTC